MARSYVCAYFTWLDQLKSCSDAEVGRLVRAALAYGRDGTVPSFPAGSKKDMAWSFLKTQIDHDLLSYDQKSVAGTKGMEKRWKRNEKGEAKPQKTGEGEIADLKAFIKSMDG